MTRVHELLIRGGRIIDGTGDPSIETDVVISDGVIAAVGRIGAETVAHVTIDATGLVVCPGFIDMHAHSDLAVITEPEHLAKVSQGVTTEVIGQDGLGYAPVDHTVLADLRVRLRGWNGEPRSVGWEWRSVSDYLDVLDGSAVNVAYLVPHGTLRLLVMGAAARPPTHGEMEGMKDLVGLAMTEGAFGLSTGLTYAPAMHAADDELGALCGVVAHAGGYYAPHHRNYGSHALEGYADCIALGEQTGVAVHLTHAHLGFEVNRGRADDLLSMVDEARRRGVDVTLDSYPYLAGATYVHSLLPGWAQEGDVDVIIDRLTDGSVRDRLRSELERGTPGSQGIPIDWSSVVVSGVSEAGNEPIVGLSIEAISKERREDPVDVYVDLLISDRLGASCLMHIGNEENVRAIMQHPFHMAGSDGLLVGQRPHPRAYGTFPRYLGHYSRDLQVVPLEEMVRKMTSLPARRLGLGDRGVIREGLAADVVCFDPVEVRDTATYDDPRRLPEGIPHVIVNGRQVIADGKHTGQLPGRALRRSSGGAK